jgi:hypothetical protein
MHIRIELRNSWVISQNQSNRGWSPKRKVQLQVNKGTEGEELLMPYQLVYNLN